jgi:fucose permease
VSAPRSTHRLAVVVAYATFVLVGVSAGVGGVLLPAQIRDYGVDKATIGITFITFSAGFLLAGVTAGRLIHRWGVRLALVVGGTAFLLSGLYTAVRPPFLALVAVQVAAGYGVGMLESVMNAYLSGLPRAAILLNRLHAFFGVGALLGPVLATWMLTALPWTAVWLVLALASVPLIVGFLRAYPTRAASTADQEAEAAPVAAGPSLLGAALRRPAVLLGAVFLTVYVGLEISVGNWGFSFLVDGHQQSRLLAGYTISGYWLGLTVGRFVISPVATRLGLTPAGTVAVCLTGVVASAVLAWLAPVAVLASVGLVLLGFFLGPAFPTAMALVPHLIPTRLVPTAIGIMNGVSVLGGALLPWLAGVAAQHVGVWTLLPCVLALAVVQLLIWWPWTRRLRVDRARSSATA